MGRLSIVHLLLELHCSIPINDRLPATIPDDTPRDHPGFFPFSNTTFCALFHNRRNPLFPPTELVHNSLGWSSDKVLAARRFGELYSGFGETKTQRADNWKANAAEIGQSAWIELSSIVSGAQFLKWVSDALDAMNEGLDAVLRQHISVRTLFTSLRPLMPHRSLQS